MKWLKSRAHKTKLINPHSLKEHESRPLKPSKLKIRHNAKNVVGTCNELPFHFKSYERLNSKIKEFINPTAPKAETAPKRISILSTDSRHLVITESSDEYDSDRREGSPREKVHWSDLDSGLAIRVWHSEEKSDTPHASKRTTIVDSSSEASSERRPLV